MVTMGGVADSGAVIPLSYGNHDGLFTQDYRRDGCGPLARLALCCGGLQVAHGKERRVFVDYHKALVLRFFAEVMNAGHLEVVDELFAAHPLLAGATKKTAAAYRRAIPDVRFTVDELIGEADRVVACWTGRGTDALALQGVATLPSRVVVSGVYIFRFADGHITGLRPLTRLPGSPMEQHAN